VNTATQIFVTLAGVFHLAVFAMESVVFRKPSTWKRFLIKSQEEAEVARPWAFNQGFYNLFLAAGIAVGLVLLESGQEDAGRAIVLFACACMVGAGVVLVSTNRRFLPAAAIQAGPPLVALIAAFAL
jgi:putative membrane protein